MKIKLFILAISFTFLYSCSLTKSVDHGWLTSLETGLEYAKKEKKGVLVLFTGSDWCPPCKKLHHEVLESEDFLKFAKKNLVLVEMDFPRKQKNQLEKEQKIYNNSLKRKFNIRGFPSVIILDKDGKELERWVGYRSTDLDVTLEKYKTALKKK